MKLSARHPWLSLFATLGLLCAADHSAVLAGEVNLSVTETGGSGPTACRVHLKTSSGEPVLPPGFPAWRDHFVCPGDARFELPAGDYGVTIERGPEYTAVETTWKIFAQDRQSFRHEIRRLAHLAGEGWWSGEIHVHRPPDDIELLMQAEDLHVAPVITWWNNQNLWTRRAPPESLLVRFDGDRYYFLMGGEDERAGGALLYFGLNSPLSIASPLPLAQQKQEYPSPMLFLSQARQHPGVWVDIEKPFWYDVPVWLASGMVDSIGIANNHMMRDRVYDGEAWGRPRDLKRFPPPNGNGLWTQEIYYHMLNCGLRIPPSAGSASGVLTNPVGYNRAYVHLDDGLTYAGWWEGLRAGRSFVTNGPLLRVKADGHWPGHVFHGAAGEAIEIKVDAVLDSRDPLERIEIIKDGRVEKTLSATEWLQPGPLGTLRFSESGWFLVRVMADVPGTFRFASTAPFYVEIGEHPRRISRASAQFFLDWTRERSARVQLADVLQQTEVLKFHTEAESFWRQKVGQANAD